MKVMINTMPPYLQGGVANYYRVMKKYWTENVRYNYVGGRRKIPGGLILFYDILKFFLRCVIVQPDLVVLNPSLRKNALRREGIFLVISKWLNIKTVVFFRGWGEKQAQKISQNPSLFNRIYSRADAFLVLATDFREQLRRWGISKPIYLTVTKVDDALLKDFNFNPDRYNRCLLFLARVEEYKGIFTALKAFKQVSKNLRSARFIVVGDGEAMDEAKAFVEDHNLKNVEFKGYASGMKVALHYAEADIYVLPTHGEGMPSSVLEAMAFGLPVVTCPVGGIKDFFEDNKMGYLIDSLEPASFAEKIQYLMEDDAERIAMRKYNYQYAQTHFKASQVAQELEQIFFKIIAGDGRAKHDGNQESANQYS